MKFFYPLLLGAFATLGTLVAPATLTGQEAIGIRIGAGLNQVVIRATEFVGECPGWESNRPEANFVSSIPSLEDRRVRVYNRSVVGEETAYTDRKYEGGTANPYITTYGSQSFRVAWLNQHSNQSLALASGQNDMVAVIYDGGRRSFLQPDKGYQEVAVHTFTVNVQTSVKRQTRNKIVTPPEIECLDGTTPLNRCPNQQRVSVRYSYCPGQTRNLSNRQIIRYLPVH